MLKGRGRGRGGRGRGLWQDNADAQADQAQEGPVEDGRRERRGGRGRRAPQHAGDLNGEHSDCSFLSLRKGLLI